LATGSGFALTADTKVSSLDFLERSESVGGSDFHRTATAEPHIARRGQIMKAHPEVRNLFGEDRTTAVWMTAIIVLQFAVAWFVSHQSLWIVFAASYFIGAVANHALFVVIHECAHNLIFKGTRANRICGIIANFPIVFPGAMGFRKYHLLHHRYQGELDWDADLAGPREAGWVKNSTLRKALWFLGFFYVEGIIRPSRLKNVMLWDRWVVLNTVIQFAVLGLIFYFMGWTALIYLGLSSVFSIGFHPVGARWIQEHYVFVKGQETYSYYGPFNRLCFNVGYHNEHHDLMRVPWSKLPQVKAMAPEFYDNLYYHPSWTGLFIRFLLDPGQSLFQRVVRRSHENVPVS
jgi:sphingolipid 4-desaturase/C4-monooxygenase